MLLKSERATVVNGSPSAGQMFGQRTETRQRRRGRHDGRRLSAQEGMRWRSPAIPTPPIINVMSEL